MFSVKFLKDAAERAVKTAAQTAIATITTSEVVGIMDLNVGTVFSVVGLSVVLSFLTSLASAGKGDKESASLVDEEKVA